MLARYMISAAVVGGTGCSFQGSPAGSTTDGGSVTVQGQIVDFQTGAAVGPTDVTVSGLSPLPHVDRQGASVTLTGVAENAAFGVLAAAPMHRSTYSQVVVTASDLSDVTWPVVGEAFVTGLAAGFGAAPSPSSGTVLLHLVDATGHPASGVAALDFTVAGTSGPHFLDGAMMPAQAATASSASGWVVFFDVPPGLVGLSQGLSAATTIDMPSLPAAAGVVTIAEGRVAQGAPVLPSHVSFATQIVPIFSARGCVACHSGGGDGKDLGGLMLTGSDNLIYKQLVQDRPGIRVNLTAPERSLVLTMPSAENPPDAHPTVVFTGPRDPDYLKLLVWIREGAQQN
ncbi:MAG TPA: hypothetical protein VHW23_25505 [Kofleriaceae bacterium]|jgi:mono/diheme cytochrome c family protein|nr:hypothetical protein [Kofleriaceae bacterium]